MNEEDEKTALESGWEEEASTTVEQGEVAERIRSLGLELEQSRRPNTNITSTTGGSMPDEPTVDDQRGALAMLPPPIIARLVITQGNDSGQALEVRPGKTYTIGRGIDNDLVLTDIAVSRKHFDIRNENGSWVLADRGSGNGTLVNHRIEDAPFMLASGDLIEIGNTAFRFDFPNGVPRTPPGYDVSLDDDLELSTVSSKPLSEPATPQKLIAPAIAPGAPPIVAPAAEAMNRSKTLPPPAPLPRPRTQSGRPPVGYALERPGPLSQSQPPAPLSSLAAALAPTMSPMQGVQALPPPPLLATTLPRPQMAHRSPLPPAALIDSPLSSLPMTIPGQGPPLQLAHPARLPFSYPSAPELPQLQGSNSSRGQMVVASAQPGRDATSTALVQPMSYSTGQPMIVPPQAYGPPPQLSRRMKMVLGGAGLALFAAVATIAIAKGSSGDLGPANKAFNAPPPRPVAPPRPTVEPIRDTRIIKSAMPPRPDKAVAPTPPMPVAAKIEKLTTTAPPPIATPTTPTPTTPTPATTKIDKLTTTASPPIATPATTKTEKIAATPPPPAPTPPAPKPAIPSPSPPITSKTDKVVETAALTSAKNDKKTPKRNDKRNDKKPAPPKLEVARSEPDRPNKVEIAASTPKIDKKRAGKSTQDVKSDANALYRAKRFADAAALVTASLPSFSGGDSQELKSIAAIYSQLGKAYNVGMAPGTKSTDAFVALRRARSYDRDVGSAYIPEIERVLVTVATKAAASYAASKEYEAAFQAVRLSESLGSTSPTNKSVRDKLEELAAELVRAASGELSADPEAAKRKLRQVEGMVDAKSPLYTKAAKLLNGS